MPGMDDLYRKASRLTGYWSQTTKAYK